MSGLLNNSSLNRSASNLQDNIAAQRFSGSFSDQSGVPSPVFQHGGSMQGLHNLHGSFSVPNMSRSSSMANVLSSGIQQPSGNLSSGRFTSNIPVSLSQISHGNSHGHTGLANRGGPGGMGVVGNPGFSSGLNAVGSSIPGILPTSAAIGNRINTGGMSPMLGNSSPRITNLAGNIIGGGNVGRGLNAGGGLSMPGLSSRLSLSTNSRSGNAGVMGGSNRLMGSMLQQASPQMMSMLGNSYHSDGPLSQNHVNSMGMMNDVNNHDSSPFDINDFPQLSSRPSSSGGAQGQIGSLRKQGLGVSPIVQQNQEFSIQNEDFPALPGFKGGNADYGMDLHQKEQLHDNASKVQSPHFPVSYKMGRSSGFNLGGTFSSHHPNQQRSNHLYGSDMFQGSHSSYHSQASGPPGIALRPLNSLNTVSGVGSFDQLIQHYPPQQNQSQFQFRLQQLSGAGQSYRDQGIKSMQAGQASPDRFGLLGLLGVVRMSDPDLTSFALGIDLTTLRLNLSSTENLHRTFGSPWSDEPVKGDPNFTVPQCYYSQQAPALNQRYFSKFQLNTLFYIFYSMPKDEAQLYAANELYNRSWFYHREHRLWFMKPANMEPLVKTNSYERGSYVCFDPNTWETTRKENFVIYYEMLDKRPALPHH